MLKLYSFGIKLYPVGTFGVAGGKKEKSKRNYKIMGEIIKK